MNLILTDTYQVGYAYDLAGNMTGLTYLDGRQVAYAWDAANRISSISDNAAPAVPYIAYAYDPAGLVVGKTLGNGVEYAASFDAVNRQTASDWQDTHHHTLAGYNYAYGQPRRGR